MQCPKCGNLETKVIDSRLTEKNRVIRRRRECDTCKTRFTTFERIEVTNMIVIKKNKTHEPYSREKLIRGIWTACRKRPITSEFVNNMINRLEERWSSKKKEILSKEIGQHVLEELKKVDLIAYIRFASVYQDFDTVDEFKKILAEI